MAIFIDSQSHERISKKKKSYKMYLKCALDTLFRDVRDNGFWNEKEGRIIYKLDYITKDGKWVPDRNIEFRFAPFGLMGALYWRYTNPHSHQNYDSNMERYLDFLVRNIQSNGKIRDNNSGGFEHGIVLATLSLGSLVWSKLDLIKAEAYLQKAETIYKFILKNWPPNYIFNNHDLFVLWGIDLLYDAEITIGKPAEAQNIKNEISKYSNWMYTILDDNGLFQTGDFRASYHQRIMYPLWGFARAVKIINEKVYLQSIERCLDHVIKHRMEWDGAFLWHPPVWIYKKKPP